MSCRTSRSKALAFLGALCLLTLSTHTGAEIYEYDEAGRLIQVTYDDAFVLRYTYDANGNILSRQQMKAELVFRNGFE